MTSTGIERITFNYIEGRVIRGDCVDNNWAFPARAESLRFFLTKSKDERRNATFQKYRIASMLEELVCATYAVFAGMTSQNHF